MIRVIQSSCRPAASSFSAAAPFTAAAQHEQTKYRRCYLAQYSAEPIMNRDGSELWGRAEAFLENGVRLEPACERRIYPNSSSVPRISIGSAKICQAASIISRNTSAQGSRPNKALRR